MCQLHRSESLLTAVTAAASKQVLRFLTEGYWMPWTSWISPCRFAGAELPPPWSLSILPSYVIRFTLIGTGLWYLMTTWHCHIEWTTMTGQYTIDCNRLLLVYNAGRGISQIDFITVPQSSLYPCVENLRSISNIIGKRHWIIYHIYMAWNSFMCDWMIYPQDRWVAKFCEHVKLVMIRCQAKLTLICRYKIWSFKSWTFLWIWHSQMGSRKLRKLAQRRCSILPGNLQLEL